MRHSRPIQRQPDLFATDVQTVPLTVPERPKLMALVSVLLAETVADPRATERNDEDHA
ncbi:MAG: hypothetical protein O3A53_19130 [Acidobacteria bacterium]|nr:hypothetical protein [Acidobacteriota bacterium]